MCIKRKKQHTLMRIINIILWVLISMPLLYSQTFSSNPNANITNDGEHCYSIVVSGVGTINNDLGLEEVCIDIDHTWDSDLDIYLEAPDGTRIELTTDNGSSGNNYKTTCFNMSATTNVTSGSAPFNGSYVPEGNLAQVNNEQDADGTWLLCIEDDTGGDNGTLNSWSIKFSNSGAQMFCNYFLGLRDTYGDGWTGGSYLDLVINGVSIGYSYVTSGDGIYSGNLITFQLNVNDGDNVDIYFHSGTFDTDDEYYIYDNSGTLIHSEGTGGTVPADYSFTVNSCNKKSFTTSDCEGAIKVCDGTYSYPQSAKGDGKYEELAGRASCWGADVLYGETVAPLGEKNSTWYIFDVQSSGNFQFTIDQTAYNTNDDYDWAVFNLTSNICDDIVNGTLNEVACNWEVSTTSTGINASGSGTGWEASFNVSAGEKYALVVDNWSENGSGYDLDLNQGTAVIFDDVSPELQGVTRHTADTVFFSFSEPVACSSVSISDFDFDGPDAPYTITDLGSEGCNAGAEYVQVYWITVTPKLHSGATYTLDLVDDVDDPCTNPTNQNDDSFLPVNLLSFNYNCDRKAFDWITASERNNNYFTIKIGEYVGSSFLSEENIIINGNGITNKASIYTKEVYLTDKYAQLWQTDYDGTKTLLETIYISCNFNIQEKVKLFPNPTNNYTSVSGHFNKMEVYDIVGKKVFPEIVGNKILGLSSGVYLVVIDNQDPIKLFVR